MNLDDLFGEATLKTLALATSADTRAHLAAGRPLRASFSAAHFVQLAGRSDWEAADQQRMERALAEEVEQRLKANDDTTAAWRAGYLKMLSGSLPWPEETLSRLAAAVAPKPGLRPWKRVWFAGQACDYHLLTGGAFWTAADLAAMLEAVRDDFQVRLRNGDRLMASDRVVLYKTLAASTPLEEKE